MSRLAIVRRGRVSQAPPSDTTPDAFSFGAPVTGATRSTVYQSPAITVSGINAPASISISGGEYQVDGGAWTGSSGTVANGASVKVRLTSSASYSTLARATLTIGGVSANFDVTTGASVSWPAYVTAPTAYPQTTTYYNGGAPVGSTSNTPAQNTTALLNAIAAATAGQTILLAAGATFGAFFLNSTRVVSPAIIVRSENQANPAVFDAAGDARALDIRNYTGLYFMDVTIQALSRINEYPVIVYLDTCTNVGFFNCTITGTNAGGTGGGLGRAFNPIRCNNIRIVKNTVQMVSYGVWAQASDNLEIIGNDWIAHSADGAQFSGTVGLLYYLNSSSPNVTNSDNHPDGFQVTAGSTTRSSDNITIFNNFVNCDTTIPIPSGGTVSGGRCQGYYFALENAAYPTGNVVFADNKSYGGWYNSMYFVSNGGIGAVTNLQVYGLNECYHIEATNPDGSPAPDAINYSSFTCLEGVGGNFNQAPIAHNLNVNLSAMTNKPSQTPNPNPANVRTNAQRVTAFNTWKAERTQYLALMGA